MMPLVLAAAVVVAAEGAAPAAPDETLAAALADDRVAFAAFDLGRPEARFAAVRLQRFLQLGRVHHIEIGADSGDTRHVVLELHRDGARIAHVDDVVTFEVRGERIVSLHRASPRSVRFLPHALTLALAFVVALLFGQMRRQAG